MSYFEPSSASAMQSNHKVGLVRIRPLGPGARLTMALPSFLRARLRSLALSHIKFHLVVHLVEDGARRCVTLCIKDGVVSLDEVESFPLPGGVVGWFFCGVDLLDNVQAGFCIGEGALI